jgi:hypothetical protein
MIPNKYLLGILGGIMIAMGILLTGFNLIFVIPICLLVFLIIGLFCPLGL